jgi:hypothetical protein
MVEHCWDGSVLWPSLARISAYSKLSLKQVKRVIRGWDEKKRDPETKAWIVVRRHRGLVERGILTEIAPFSKRDQRPTTYRLNEAALSVDPKMVPYIREEDQQELPGIDLSAIPGKPIRPRQKTLPGMRTRRAPGQKSLPGISTASGHHAPCDQMDTQVTVSPDCPPGLRSPCPEPPDTVTPDYLLKPAVPFSVDVAVGVAVPPAVPLNQPPVTPTTSAPSSPRTVENSEMELLSKGLRELPTLETLDHKAIERIYRECRQNVPDATIEEILCLAWEKVPALRKADNPAGMLIFSLPIACNPQSIDNLRQRQQAAAAERQREQQRETERQETLRREIEAMQARDRRADDLIAALPRAEREQITKQIREQVARVYPDWLPVAIEQTTKQYLAKHVLGEEYELPQPKPKSQREGWWRNL